MTTTTTTTALNIISALPLWMKASNDINGTLDGWVPVHCLKLSTNELSQAYHFGIIDWVIDTDNKVEVKFLQEDVTTIYNWLS